jgi:hypothetical protein
MKCLQKLIFSAPNENRLHYGVINLTPCFIVVSMSPPYSHAFYSLAVKVLLQAHPWNPESKSSFFSIFMKSV